MTIYLYIDLPFNEIGCYPTSLRNGKKRKKVRGGEGKAGQLLRGHLISCFSLWLLTAWIWSHSTSSGKHMSSPLGCIQAGVLFYIHVLYHLISPCSPHTRWTDLIIEESTSLASPSLPRPLCLTVFSIMRGPLLILGL